MTQRWVVSLAVMLGGIGPVARAQGAAEAVVEVTLAEAVRRALEVQPAMIEARGNERTTGAIRRTAIGSFLPTITTGASATRSNQPRRETGDTVTLPPGYSYSGTLNASMDLFAGFRRVANVRAASANLDAASVGVVNQRFQVTLTTKRAFYNALAAEELVRVREAQVRRAQQQLQTSVEKLRAGSATRSDSLRSTVEYGTARIQLLQARANLATTRADLGRQIGVDQPVRALPETGLADLPDTLELRRWALAAAPQVQQAEATARAARAQVWTARGLYWPTLNVSYGTTRTGIDDPSLPFFGNYNERFEWRFGFSWTLFNGFSREQQQVSSSATRDLAEARAAEARRQVNASLTQQLAALATGFEQIDIARATVAAATEDLRVQQERYRVGAATMLDLLTSQAALTDAEQGLVQARFDYLIARAQVEALVGRTL